MFQFMVSQDEIHPDLKGRQSTDMPIIPSAEVNLKGKAYRWMKAASGQWQLQDRFCNPGPVQFDGRYGSPLVSQLNFLLSPYQILSVLGCKLYNRICM